MDSFFSLSMCIVWNTTGILAHWHANNREETRDRDISLVIRSLYHYGKESRRYENAQTFVFPKIPMFGAKTCVHCRAICTLLLNGESIDNDILLNIGYVASNNNFTVNKNNSTVLVDPFLSK